jgi:hypothetical protein
MKDFICKLSPNASSASSASHDQTELTSLTHFTTSNYKIHYLETLNGLRFILTTDPSVQRATDTLFQLYKLYVDYMVKNPLSIVYDGALLVSPLSSTSPFSPNYIPTNTIPTTSAPPFSNLEIECPVFVEKAIALIEQLPYFQ